MEFTDLLNFMRNGGRIQHEEWCETEYLTIKDGELVDEDGELFTISPWLIDNNGWSKLI